MDRQFTYPPRPTAGLVGRFGLVDLVFFAVALLLAFVGFRLITVSIWWPVGLGLLALLVGAVPLPRIGGRPLTGYLLPLASTVGDRLTGRGVFRGAVFSPSSLAYRMDLPGDLVHYRPVAVPTPDGRSQIGLMVNDREKVACAALLTFGSSVLLEGSAEQGLRLDGWESVMETFCAEGAGVSSWQLLARTAPDVVNVASRHARERAVTRSGPAWAATQELVRQAAPSAPRHEVYLVVAFDLSVLGGEIADLAKGADRDEAIGVVVLERLLDLERGVRDAQIDSDGWLRPGQYAAVIKTQFDPESLPLYDILGGRDGEVDPRLAGPSATQRSWQSFRHDSAVSRTVWVHELPKRPVGMNWLAPVLQQSGFRRTLSLVAEPLGEVRAQASAERQALRVESSADTQRKMGKPTSARLRKERQAAADQDEAQAAGDGVFRYHLFLTVTAPDELTLTKHTLAARRRLIKCKCASVVLYGEQDQAFFAGALPLARGLRPMRGVAGV
jgi:hypothetical protein